MDLGKQRSAWLISKKDWLWLLLFPLYLIIGTFRHELSHAVVASAQGAEILKFKFWPSFFEDGTFYFGYVQWRGATTWLVDAAPYFFDILTYAITFPLVYWVRYKRHWFWLNLVIVGLISPLINSAHNYLVGGDVEDLMAVFPDLLVHGFFLLGLGLGLLGLVLVLTRSRLAQKD